MCGDLSAEVRTHVSGNQGMKAPAPPTPAAPHDPLEKHLAPHFLGSTGLEGSRPRTDCPPEVRGGAAV